MILSNMGYSLSISGLFHGIKSPGLEVRDRDLLAAHDHVWIQYFTVNMHAVLACMHVVCMRGKSSSNIIKIPIGWKYVEILKMPFAGIKSVMPLYMKLIFAAMYIRCQLTQVNWD